MLYSFTDVIKVIRPLKGIFDKKIFTEFLIILANCSVDVTAAVDKCIDSSIYIFGVNDLLYITLYIFGSLKCLMPSASIKKALIEPILWFSGCLN